MPRYVYTSRFTGGRNALQYVPALVRYVEAKALLGGTTTTQGVMLFSFSGIVTYYAGIVRNVERTLDPELPVSTSHVGDVAAKSAAQFRQALEHGTHYLLHLSEGTDAAARQHFLDLEVKKDEWAINANLAGIHCVALTRPTRTGDLLSRTQKVEGSSRREIPIAMRGCEPSRRTVPTDFCFVTQSLPGLAIPWRRSRTKKTRICRSFPSG